MNAANTPSVLLVDDEILFVKAACKLLGRAGFAATGCHTLANARRALDAGRPDMIVLDVRLPDGSGLELLEELAARNDAPPVVVLTAFGAVEDAVLAMKLGASEYLQKPCDMEQIIGIARQLATGGLSGSPAAPGDSGSSRTDELIGDSAVIRDLREQLARIAVLSKRSALPPPTVLLVGETGVGKGLVAQRLHANCSRHRGPLVQVDCAALPRELIESELFGHDKGAFTGAHRDKAGLIEQAAGGTLFLDEIGELPQDLQAKLLAVLDRRRARRVGGTAEYATDAWFIAATHRDLADLSAAGGFRRDLYYRLSPLTIRIPTLRERPEDIPLLARHFLARFLAQYELDTAFSPAAEQCLVGHSWPGNVRELIGVVERALYASHGDTIEPAHLGIASAGRPPDHAPPADVPALREVELDLIRRALQDTNGNVSEAARRLGMTRMMLRYRIRKFGLAAKSDQDDGS